MWLPSGFPSLWCQALSHSFARTGSTEPGSEILLLTPKARQAVGEPASAWAFFSLWKEVCALWMSCTWGERPGICCCFYGTTDSLCAPPTASVWLADCVCAWALREVGLGLGGELFPFAPCAWLCFAIPSLGVSVCEGGVYGHRFEFQANLRPEREQGVGGWMGWEPKAFPGITQSSDATVAFECPQH